MNYDAINSRGCSVAGEVGVIFRCSEEESSFSAQRGRLLKIYEEVITLYEFLVQI